MELHPVRLLLTLLAISGAIYVAHSFVFAPPPPPGLDLRLLKGIVEHHPGDGTWRRAESETRVGPGERLRTGRASMATLALPQSASVTLNEGTELLLTDLQTTVQEITLHRGALDVAIELYPRRVVRLTVEGSHASVESIGGRFSLQSDGRGEMQLHTVSGDVRLSRAGQVRRVRAGQEVRYRYGVRPVARVARAAPGASVIPSTAILKANWPKRTASPRPAGRKHAGKTIVGAVVSIRGVNVEPRPPRKVSEKQPAGPMAPARPAPRPKRRAASIVAPAPSPAAMPVAPATPESTKPPPPDPPRVHVPSWE